MNSGIAKGYASDTHLDGTDDLYRWRVSISVFDLFKVGIGPSSSHTVGPMRAAKMFATGLQSRGLFDRTATLRAELFGSLAATGKGHGTDKAIILGLEGEDPETVDTTTVDARKAAVDAAGSLMLLGIRPITFHLGEHLVIHRRKALAFHPNGMTFTAYDDANKVIDQRTYYSVGGGFVVDENSTGPDRIVADSTPLAHPFLTGAELLAQCKTTGLPISGVMLANERAWRTDAEIHDGLLHLWKVMQDCVAAGCATGGILPGGLKVTRRAAELHRRLIADPFDTDPLRVMDWVNLFALAVNEENAAGGRVVTAPTNGAAGIIPAVLHYYTRFVKGATNDGVVRLMLTAGAIGILLKENASISGAEVGCQGEVGSACSMAAAGLTEVLGGSPEQAENAAEIAMEHHLGLTCDPVGGLVQVPCIERNAIGSIKAINSARMALYGSGEHIVSLDRVIKTMRDTGRDMHTKYKETSRGGLAVNVIEC